VSGVGRKDMEIVKRESRTGSKNWILKIHAKWLKDNGYLDQAKECAWHAENYNRFEDVRQMRWGNRKK
tara:strand:+ start:84 stop:287 length:204 start_codon:yes stop_codon:yes gene_type:complete